MSSHTEMTSTRPWPALLGLPEGAGGPWSYADASAYCERLARSHYENFPLASFMIPREQRRHLYHVYAFCRWSDDLGDELGDTGASLQWLDAWDEALREAYDERTSHPVMVALSRTVQEYQLPIEPFQRLIEAFRMDQRQQRWATFDELRHYCRHSADPVGHLYLGLFGVHGEEEQRLADYTCTALQLTNFWQDVARDLENGRIYLPLEDFKRFNYTETQLRQGECNEQFRQLMAYEIARVRGWFAQGLALCSRVPRVARLDVELFTRGGQAILDGIERIDYDVLHRRPTISKAGQARLFWSRCWPAWWDMVRGHTS